MAISDTQKVDLLFKKVAYGLTKTDVAGNKSAANESIASEIPTYAQNIWTQASLIPGTPPTATDSLVQVYTVAASNSHLNLTMDPTADPLHTFVTGLQDWIPFSFGSQYAVKVYIGDPASGGSQIFPDGSGNNDEFYFDYQAGVLNFIGANLPAGVASGNVYLEGYRYIGSKGLTAGGGLAAQSLTFPDIATRDASTLVAAGDIVKVDDNGDGEYAVYIANASGPTSDFTLISTKDSADSDEANTYQVTINFGDPAGTTLITNPSGGTRITNMIVEVITPFNATGAELSIGTIGITDQFMLADENDLSVVDEYLGFTNYLFPGSIDANNNIVVDYVPGTGGTQGQATVTITVA